MPRVNVAILGAIDRFNYGDLLFPYIIESALQELGDNFHFEYFGLVKSDWSAKGGLPTQSLKSFYKKVQQGSIDAVIIAGGESFGTDWTKLYGYVNPTFWKLRHSRFGKYAWMDKLTKAVLGAKTKFPFIFTNKELNANTPIILNSLGGHHFKVESSSTIDEIVKTLKDIDYVSVRDRDTYEGLIQKGVGSTQLFPDSAILMSQYFSREFLHKKLSPSVLDKLTSLGDQYIFFQVSKFKYGSSLTPIMENLKALIEKGYKICLCPIGTAAGHEDQIPLGEIHQHLGESSVLIDSPSLWDIMYLIAQSNLYIGTSLHGVITAMSFDVPYLGLNKTVKKLKTYLETWACEELIGMTETNEICERALKAVQTPKAKLEDSGRRQMELAQQSFKNILEIIKK